MEVKQGLESIKVKFCRDLPLSDKYKTQH